MHDDEVPIDERLVRRLISDQFSELAPLVIREVRSTGTVNAVFRLGEELAVRLPRVPAWAEALTRELTWLPVLSPQLTIAVPRPVHIGIASRDYPLPWALYEWIPGSPYSDGGIDDERQAARDLAGFITELRRIDPGGAPPAGRRPLLELDVITRESIAASAGVIDTQAAMRVWEDTVDAPGWVGDPVWIHTDLLRPNLLVDRGKLRAVIDWGGTGAGDPAADVVAAWSVFGSVGRSEFRRLLDVSEETWIRARGFALHQAALIIPYYRETNPAFVKTAARTVHELLVDSTN